MVSYGDCNTTEDAAVTADTETLLADLVIPAGKGGTIKKIRVAYGGVVDAKGATGYVELKLGSHPGPYRFPVGFGQGGATNTSPTHAEEIDVDIPVLASETVKLYITLAEAGVSAFGGIIWTA